jgi:hypothetical protein
MVAKIDRLRGASGSKLTDPDATQTLPIRNVMSDSLEEQIREAWQLASERAERAARWAFSKVCWTKSEGSIFAWSIVGNRTRATIRR